jgi:hypothetical protein
MNKQNIFEDTLEEQTENIPLNWLIYRETEEGHCDMTVHVEDKFPDYWTGWIAHDTHTQVVASGKFPYGWNKVYARWKIQKIYIGKYLPRGDYTI